MGTGRKSLYTDEMPKIALECLSKGFSKKAAAGEMGINPRTFVRWEEEYPEFAEAVEIGLAKSAVVWEETLMTSARDGIGNPASIIFGLKNRHYDEWRDKVEVEKTVEHSVAESSADTLRDILFGGAETGEED